MQKKTLRLLLAGGGSGGHVLPMLAVVQALRSQSSFEVEAFHMGSASAIERHIFEDTGIRSEPLDVSGLRGSNPFRAAWRALKMVGAVRSAVNAIDRFQPDVAFATGGYASVPMILAARLRRKPVVLFSADVSAGLAIRFAARFAQRVAVPVAEAEANLPGNKTFVSGYPVRAELLQPMEKRAAKEQLGFDPDQPLLLCFGGSQGAHTLNAAIERGLAELLPLTQILHLAGSADAPALQAKASPRYQARAYLDEMPVALAAADLCVCRAGASTLGELPATGLPALLVPGPFAGGHQRYNAAVLADAGAAVIISNEDAAAGELTPEIVTLLGDKERLAQMSAAMRRLARPDAAGNIARVLAELAA